MVVVAVGRVVVAGVVVVAAGGCAPVVAGVVVVTVVAVGSAIVPVPALATVAGSALESVSDCGAPPWASVSPPAAGRSGTRTSM